MASIPALLPNCGCAFRGGGGGGGGIVGQLSARVKWYNVSQRKEREKWQEGVEEMGGKGEKKRRDSGGLMATTFTSILPL
jgi:hypothetical protein